MDKPDVNLIQMSEEDFALFEDRVVREYAEQSVAAGRVKSESAIEWSRKETAKFLPEGIRTPDALLLTIVSRRHPGVSLGSIWCGRDVHNPAHAFIYDLFVQPEQRGHGYATAAMTALEPLLRDQGYKAVDLHVYARNKTAISLYRKRGFHETSLNFRKEL